MSDALRAYLEAMPQYERDALISDRWNCISDVVRQFEATEDDVRATLKDLAAVQSAARWLFVWLVSLNQAHGRGQVSVKGLKIGLALFGCANPRRPYVWPSQQTLADQSGWSRGNRRGVYDGLRELSDELGAVRRLRFVDLPAEVKADAEVANRGRKDPRSAAYALVPANQWKTDVSPMGKHTSVSPWEALNSKVKHQPASPDSFTDVQGDHNQTFQQGETYQYGNEGKRHG